MTNTTGKTDTVRRLWLAMLRRLTVANPAVKFTTCEETRRPWQLVISWKNAELQSRRLCLLRDRVLLSWRHAEFGWAPLAGPFTYDDHDLLARLRAELAKIGIKV